MFAQQSTDFGAFAPSVAVVVAAVLAIAVVRAILRKRNDGGRPEARWQAQAWTFVIAGLGLIAFVLVLPSGDLDKQTVLSVLGLALTAVIALSASTIVANAMAGLMLHRVGNFRPGDYVRISDHFGRVTERGLFHTELQTEDGDLTTLPNSLLVNNAVTVIRASGTVISCSVSLGYDVPRTQVEKLLVEAAAAVELQEPFVHILELGDFSVTYRIAGFLPEVRHMLRTRSRLRSIVLDTLHDARIEIVSPNFMNQRILESGIQFIPEPVRDVGDSFDEVPEDLVFDKAERAGRLEELRDRRKALQSDLNALDAEARASRTAGDDGRRAATQRMLNHVEYLIGVLQGDGSGG